LPLESRVLRRRQGNLWKRVFAACAVKLGIGRRRHERGSTTGAQVLRSSGMAAVG
jgi:hypothetical protein